MRLRFLPLVALLTLTTRVAAADLNVISAVEVRSEGGAVVVSIKGTHRPSFTTFALSDPPRFVIDFSESRFQGVPEEQKVADPTVAAIKNESFGSDASAIARVMISFTGDVDPPQIDATVDGLLVRIDRPMAPAGQAVAAAASHPAAAAPATPPAAPAVALAVPTPPAEVPVAAPAAAPVAAAPAPAAAAAAPAATLDDQDEALAAKAEARRRAAEAEAEAARPVEPAPAPAPTPAAEVAVAAPAAAPVAAAPAPAAAAPAPAAPPPAPAPAVAERPVPPPPPPPVAAKPAPVEPPAAPPVVASARATPERLAPDTAPDVRLREVGFKQLPTVSRVFVRTSGTPRFTVQDAGDDIIRIELENTRVDRVNDLRFLDTSFFGSAVTRITPRREGSSYVLEVKLRKRVPYQQKIEGDTLALDFERPSAAPAAGAATPDARTEDTAAP